MQDRLDCSLAFQKNSQKLLFSWIFNFIFILFLSTFVSGTIGNFCKETLWKEKRKGKLFVVFTALKLSRGLLRFFKKKFSEISNCLFLSDSGLLGWTSDSELQTSSKFKEKIFKEKNFSFCFWQRFELTILKFPKATSLLSTIPRYSWKLRSSSFCSLRNSSRKKHPDIR